MHTEVGFVSLDRPDVFVEPGRSHGQDVRGHIRNCGGRLRGLVRELCLEPLYSLCKLGFRVGL